MMKWYILNSELAPMAESSFDEDAAETSSTGFMNIWTATSTLRLHTHWKCGVGAGCAESGLPYGSWLRTQRT